MPKLPTPIKTDKIVISEVKPPIPTTAFDYCAFYEGEEELQQYGWGPSEQEALNDLYNQYETGFFVTATEFENTVRMADILRKLRKFRQGE